MRSLQCQDASEGSFEESYVEALVIWRDLGGNNSHCKPFGKPSEMNYDEF